MTTLKQIDRLNRKLNGYKKAVQKSQKRTSIWQRIAVDNDGALYAVTAKGWNSGNLFDYNESTLIGRSYEAATEWLQNMNAQLSK